MINKENLNIRNLNDYELKTVAGGENPFRKWGRQIGGAWCAIKEYGEAYARTWDGHSGYGGAF